MLGDVVILGVIVMIRDVVIILKRGYGYVGS